MKINRVFTFLTVFAILASLLAITACTIESDFVDRIAEQIKTDLDSPGDSVTYQLTTISGTGGVILSPSVSPLAVVKDDSISLKAQANSGYIFDFWIATAGEPNIDDTSAAETIIILSTGDATVQAVYIDLTAPDPPTVNGDVKTNTALPTWSWVSAGGDVSGIFRYKLDDSIMSSGATETTETSFTSASALPDGNHTLFVQEKDDAGNWSNIGSFTIEVDTTAPDAPIFHVTNYSKTASTRPTWTWKNGDGDGVRIFRFKLDNNDLSDIPEIDETSDTSFTPELGDNLSEGDHILYIQEKDDVDNWSSSASHTIEVDLTGPAAPTVTSSSPSWDMTPTWTWTSNSSDGTGTYRYRIDDNDLSGQTGYETTTYTSGSTLGNATHHLYVQEQDDVDNWGSIGNFAVVVSWGAPSLSSPLNAGISSSIEVSLDWNSLYNGGIYASGYYVQLDDNSNFDSPMAWTTTDSRYTSSTRLTPGTTYYWHARAMNPDGDYGGYSSRWSFSAQHQERDVVTGVAPAGGIIIYNDQDFAGMQDMYYNGFGMSPINFVSLPDDYRYIEVSLIHASSDSVLNTPSGLLNQNVETDTAIGTGMENTTTLASGGAVDLAESYSYTYQGKTYSDWFLPSSEILEIVSIIFDDYPQEEADAVAYWSSSYVELPVPGAYVVIFKDVTISGTSYSPGDVVLVPVEGDITGQVDIGVLTARMF